MKIVLIGYMASGKSSVGKKLSKILKLPFYDLDDYIAEKENLSIPNIFKIKGEVYFRKIETTFLGDLLHSTDDFILAVGGGTPCYGSNMKLINKYSKSIYLKSSFKNTYNKLSKPKVKNKRPLIATIANENLEEFIAKHLFERSPFYEQAQHSISIDGKTVREIANEINLSIL